MSFSTLIIVFFPTGCDYYWRHLPGGQCVQGREVECGGQDSRDQWGGLHQSNVGWGHSGPRGCGSTYASHRVERANWWRYTVANTFRTKLIGSPSVLGWNHRKWRWTSNLLKSFRPRLFSPFWIQHLLQQISYLERCQGYFAPFIFWTTCMHSLQLVILERMLISHM